jgi:hypothetical protein
VRRVFPPTYHLSGSELPKDAGGERSIWPPIVLTAADKCGPGASEGDIDNAVADALNIPRPPRALPPTGTGPITDADVEAAEAFIGALMPWSLAHGVTSPSELASLAERVANLTSERDDLRETVDQIAEHVGAKTRGATHGFVRLMRDEVRLFVRNLTRERDTAIDAFHRCRIERDQIRASGDAAAIVWADERTVLIGERDAARNRLDEEEEATLDARLERDEARAEVADDHVRRVIANLTAERDEARGSVARLTAELAAAYALASVRGWDLVP